MSKNLLICVSCILWFFTKPIFSTQKALETVPYVSLTKYLGKWYEVAKLPNSFQNKCQYNTTANYSLITGEDLKVVNECRAKEVGAEEKIYKAEGTAWVVDKISNSKLKVSFVPFLHKLHFWGGDYWIIELASDYSYAVVGSKDRKYLWILARTPTLPDQLYDSIISKIKTKGFNVEKIEKSIQK
ncbi:MAG: lipocalin family protein [Rickettsiaceae bacterium]|nr:lipocalin family protein [Rickettsiaceae bacterium]